MLKNIFLVFSFLGLAGWFFGSLRWLFTYNDIGYAVWSFGFLAIASFCLFAWFKQYLSK